MNNILVIYFYEIFVLGCGLEWGLLWWTSEGILFTLIILSKTTCRKNKKSPRYYLMPKMYILTIEPRAWNSKTISTTRVWRPMARNQVPSSVGHVAFQKPLSKPPSKGLLKPYQIWRRPTSTYRALWMSKKHSKKSTKNSMKNLLIINPKFNRPPRWLHSWRTGKCTSNGPKWICKFCTNPKLSESNKSKKKSTCIPTSWGSLWTKKDPPSPSSPSSLKPSQKLSGSAHAACRPINLFP